MTKNLQQLVEYVPSATNSSDKKTIIDVLSILTSIKIFAERGALRNYFQTLFRSGIDADKIWEHREKLHQSMRVFGVGVLPTHTMESALMHHLPQLQSDIILRETVAKLASRQNEMMNSLQNRVPRVPSIPGQSEDRPKQLLTSTSVDPRTKVESMTGSVAVIWIICLGIMISLYIRHIKGD